MCQKKTKDYFITLNVLVTVKCTSLTEKRHSLSWRSSTSRTSTHMLLLVGACQAPASVPRPGRHGRTLLANCRHSGQVNSPLSTEKPWRTWSFWGEMGWTMLKLSGTMIILNKDLMNCCTNAGRSVSKSNSSLTLKDSIYDFWQSICKVCPQVWT